MTTLKISKDKIKDIHNYDGIYICRMKTISDYNNICDWLMTEDIDFCDNPLVNSVAFSSSVVTIEIND